MSSVCVLFLDVEDPVRSEITRQFTSLELAVTSSAFQACTVGVVVACQFSAALCQRVRELTCGGLNRMLVFGVGPEPFSISHEWELMDSGAADVLWSPAQGLGARSVCARLKHWLAIDEFLGSPTVSARLAGRSPAWITALRQAIEVARFSEAPLLILGESGTGKELVARLIHDLDPRPQKRAFVVLDCTTVVPELSGSEFFGHERGAFTGAVATREGAFELADGGTLFLDEVGELPNGLQAELLRVVQEGTFKRLGSSVWRRTKFRLICATHRNLSDEEAEGRFRRDFYHRIAGSLCKLPALKDREEDIPVLVRRFFEECSSATFELDPVVEDFLVRRPYPGNVRELKQLVSQLVRRHVGPGPITIGDIPESERVSRASLRTDWRDAQLDCLIRTALSFGAGLRDITAAAADTAIRIALEQEGGSLRRAAARLGVTDRALQMRKANRRAPESVGQAS